MCTVMASDEAPRIAEMPDYEIIAGTSRIVLPSTPTEFSSKPKILLVPRPTTSPNDPLNWARPRKYLHSSILYFITAFTAATSNVAGSAQEGLNREFGITLRSMNIGAGILFVGIGSWTFLISPAAWLYGRRLPYIICISLGLIGAIWMAHTNDTPDSIWNQFFVGASESVAEANVQLSLSDIWFEHQRGAVLGIYVLATSVGTFLGPLVGNFVAENLGWRWVAWLSVIISSATILVLYFGLEETLFVRNDSAHKTFSEAIQRTLEYDHFLYKTDKFEDPKSLDRATSRLETPLTYWESIRLITPAPNLIGTGLRQYYACLVRTLRIFTFPAVIYSGIQWGAQDAWLTFYLTLEDDSWEIRSSNEKEYQKALMDISTLLGAVGGCFWGGYLSDQFVLYLARQRNGIREAEDRLWMMLPCAILSPAGLLVFGIGAAEGWSTGWSYVSLAMIGFAWGCAGDLSMAYVMDAYPDLVLEGMVGVSVINNTLGCIFTFAASSWLERSGIRSCMIGVGCLSLFFFSLTVPMSVWGKFCRRWTARTYKELVDMKHFS